MNTRFRTLLSKTPLGTKKEPKEEPKEEPADSDSTPPKTTKTWQQNIISTLNPQRQALITHLFEASDKVGKLDPLQLAMNWFYLCKESDPVKLDKFLSRIDDTDLGLNVPVASLSWEYSHSAKLSVASYLETEAQFLDFLEGEYSADDIVLFRPGAQTALPAHTILLNRKHRTIFVAIRGTSSFDDVFADLAGLDSPFSNGRAHTGVSACVDLLLSRLHRESIGKHARVRYTNAESTVEEPKFGSWKYVCPGTVLSGDTDDTAAEGAKEDESETSPATPPSTPTAAPSSSSESPSETSSDESATPPGLDGIALILQRLITISCTGSLDLNGEKDLPTRGYKGFRIIVTGHSLGGAVSALLSCRLRQLLRFPGITYAEDAEDPLAPLPYALAPAVLSPAAITPPSLAKDTDKPKDAAAPANATQSEDSSTKTEDVTTTKDDPEAPQSGAAAMPVQDTTQDTEKNNSDTNTPDTNVEPDTDADVSVASESAPEVSFSGHHLPPPVPIFSIGFGTPPPCCPLLSAVSALTLMDLELFDSLPDTPESDAVTPDTTHSDLWESWEPERFLVGPAYSMAYDNISLSTPQRDVGTAEVVSETTESASVFNILSSIVSTVLRHNSDVTTNKQGPPSPPSFAWCPIDWIRNQWDYTLALCTTFVYSYDPVPRITLASVRHLSDRLSNDELSASAKEWYSTSAKQLAKEALSQTLSQTATRWKGMLQNFGEKKKPIIYTSSSTSATVAITTDTSTTTLQTTISQSTIAFSGETSTDEDTNPYAPMLRLTIDPHGAPSSSTTSTFSSARTTRPPYHPRYTAPHSTRRTIREHSPIARYLTAWKMNVCSPDRALVPPGRLLYVAKKFYEESQGNKEEISTKVSSADGTKVENTVETVRVTTVANTDTEDVSTPSNPETSPTSSSDDTVDISPKVAKLLAFRAQPVGDADSSYQCQFIPHKALWNIPVRGSITTDHDKEMYQYATNCLTT